MSDNLLKYLSGEMTFSDWLDSQEIPEQATKESILQKVQGLGTGSTSSAQTSCTGSSLVDAVREGTNLLPTSSKAIESQDSEGSGEELDDFDDDDDDDDLDLEITTTGKPCCKH